MHNTFNNFKVETFTPIMASLTRSGRVYAPTKSFSGDLLEPVLSPRKRKQKNVVTPEKTELISEKDTLDKDENATQVCNNQFECITVELFDQSTLCEETYQFTNLMSPDNTFKYSSPSETESEISTGFGGWETNEGQGLDTDAKQSFNLHVSALNPPPTTVPRYPLVPRNSYGGIRDCLPPEQLARWINLTRKTNSEVEAHVQSEIELQSAPSSKSFTAEQMLRMEQNKVKALEKLRANSMQTQTRNTYKSKTV